MIKYRQVKEKVGLDIDEVVCGFNQGFINEANKMGLGEHFANSAEEVNSWDLGSSRDKFLEVFKYIQLDPDFWLNLVPLNYPDFVPYCYITSRPIAGDVTQQWLREKGMPDAPLITVSAPERKLAHILQLELDLFVDDYYPTIRGVIGAGAKGVLFESPYQMGHDCSGLPVVNVLEYEELKKFI